VTTNGKDKIAAIISRLPKTGPRPRIPFHEAASEIAASLNITFEAATMTLYGLCATGNVHWVDDSGEVVEEHELTVANFSSKPAFVVADDVRSCLADWSPQPQRSQRDRVISGLLVEGHNPPRNIKWKPFCDLVRDKCNGWLKAGKPALGFGDKQIQRAVKELRSK
jgi:hypothetical protein